MTDLSGNPFVGDHLGISAVYKGLGRPKNQSESTKKVTLHGVSLTLHDEKSGHGGGDHGEGTWIYSFADLIMNLLMFFVMMFAISTIDKNKFSQIQEAFSTLSSSSAKKDVDHTTSSTAGVDTGLTASDSDQSMTQGPLSNAEILERVKKLLLQVDEKTLNVSDLQKAELKSLTPKVDKLANAVAASQKSDPLANAFDVVIPAKRLFVADSLSTVGLKLFSKLSGELKTVKSQLSINVTSYLPEQKDKDMLARSSLRASLIARFLRTHLKIEAHKVSAAGFGAATEDAFSSEERVVVRIALSALAPGPHGQGRQAK